MIWGSGKPMREFLHVDDMAAASVFVMELEAGVYQAHTDPMCSHINVGTGVDCTIRELARTLCRVVGYEGALVFDADKPDGTPRKLLDSGRLRSLGWTPAIELEPGLEQTYAWYRSHRDGARS